MDITLEMQQNMNGRGVGWPAAYSCPSPPPSANASWAEGELCAPSSIQRLRHNYAAKIERLDGLFGQYHLRGISIMIGNLDWLRFAYVFAMPTLIVNLV
jgi:hypothetical protein